MARDTGRCPFVNHPQTRRAGLGPAILAKTRIDPSRFFLHDRFTKRADQPTDGRTRAAQQGLTGPMKTAGVLIVAVLALSACGGGERMSRNYGGAVSRAPSVSFASGPISKACLKSGRKAANARLCGCIQGVANRDLSSSDQRRAVKFFADPHEAQVVRQSDNPGNEAFWQRYKAFAGRAEQVCSGL